MLHDPGTHCEPWERSERLADRSEQSTASVRYVSGMPDMSRMSGTPDTGQDMAEAQASRTTPSASQRTRFSNAGGGGRLADRELQAKGSVRNLVVCPLCEHSIPAYRDSQMKAQDKLGHTPR